MPFPWYRRRRGRPAGHSTVRLDLVALEEREVPTTFQSPFFLDTQHRLWAATSSSGDFVNTGGFGKSLSVGTDAAGNQMAVIRDFNNQVYIFDQGTWIATGGFAQDLVAGINGELFIRDFNNLVYHYQIGVGWGIAHSVGTGNLLDYYAVQMSIGRNAYVNVPFTGPQLIENVLFIRTGSNRVLEYQDSGTFDSKTQTYLPTWTDTGANGIDVAAGYNGDAFLRDGNNQLYFDAGAGSQGFTKVGALATSMDVGQFYFPIGGASDYVAYRDANSRVHIFIVTLDRFIDTGGYSTQVVAGSNEVYIRDFNKGIHFFDMDFNRWFNTGGFGNLIRDTNNDGTPNSLAHVNVDQLAVLDGNNRLHIYNGASWTMFPFFAVDVEGFQTATFTPPLM
jgi:hypothetical protein